MSYADIVRECLEHVEHRPTSKGWVNMNCPFCPDKVGKIDKGRKLGVNIHTGRFKCFRCDTWGYLGGDYQPKEDAPAPVEFAMPSSYETPDPQAIAHRRGVEYIRQRGIRADIAKAVGIGLCTTGKDAGRIIVPLKDKSDRWWGWFGRSWSATARLPHFYPVGMDRSRMFNQQAIWSGARSPILVVEGALDALPYWPDAVACLGKPGGPQLDTLMRSPRPVVFALDGDAWEESMWHAIRFRFEGRTAGYVRLPPKADPNSVDTSWLLRRARECLTEAL